ncbi:MAG: TonB family protein, partial [Vulcanimicrobiaceae bacterium]
KLDPTDEDALWLAPGPASIVLDTQPTKALETTSCTHPFRPATTEYVAQLTYPKVLEPENPSGMTVVEVAINRDGSLADAWIRAPSGYDVFDEAALATARASRYTNARSYCTNVPGLFLFKATFDSK